MQFISVGIFNPLQELGNIILSYREAEASLQNFDQLMKKPIESRPETPVDIGPVSHLRNPSTCLTGVYKIPALYGRWRTVLTNTNPIAAYRGAGRPDIAYVIERLVSQAAVETGIDPAELLRALAPPGEAFPVTELECLLEDARQVRVFIRPFNRSP